MGYSMSYDDGKFRIKAANKDSALRAIKVLVEKGPIDWVDSDDIKNCQSLAAAMERWRWPVEEDESGDVVSIDFSGEKAGDDLKLFQTLAPFVEEGSYIEMHGEDGARWRWVFDKTTCVEKAAKVSWD